MLRRKLGLGGVVGPVAFVACWVIAGATSTGYSAVDDAISDLAAVGASTRVAMTTGFVVFGLGVTAFGFALRSSLDGHAWLACVVTALCTLGVAATPLGGWSGDTAHALFAGSGYLALAAAPLLAARVFARGGHRDWARASTVIAVACALCLVASTLGPAHGLWQRLGLTIGDVWIVTTALALVGARGPFAGVS